MFIQIIYYGRSSLSPNVFIYLNHLFVLVWTYVYLFSALCYSPVVHYLFCFSDCPSFGHRGLLELAPVSL